MIDRLITRSVKVEIEPSGAELASCFWAMCSEDQAVFFNTLDRISDGRLVFQLQSITDCPTLEAGGRSAMSYIGDYSVKSE